MHDRASVLETQEVQPGNDDTRNEKKKKHEEKNINVNLKKKNLMEQTYSPSYINTYNKIITS